jgi:hypothetical protein
MLTAILMFFSVIRAQDQPGYLPLPRHSPLTIMPLDVNRDGSLELLMTMRSSPDPFDLDLSLIVYVEDNTVGIIRLFPLSPALYPPSTPSNRLIPWAITVYPQRDAHNRTYMGLTLVPLTDPYVSGLLVIRWDDWQPEIVAFEPEFCFGGAWYVRADGALILPVVGSVPSQGCVVPTHGTRPGVVIADAALPPP